MGRVELGRRSVAEDAKDSRNIRKGAQEAGKPWPILIDLPGPKIRVGKLKHEPVDLRKGHTIWLSARKIMRVFQESIPVDYPKLSQSVKIGHLIYLNDGFIQLKVEDIRGSAIKCQVLVGGQLYSYKGLNIPEGKLFV